MKNHTAFLIKLLKDRPLERVVEIGVFRGDNAFGLLENLPIGAYIGIDPYKRYKAFDNNLANKKGPMARADLKVVKRNMLERLSPFKDRFQLIEDMSTNVAAQFDDETFDFIFIDGNHFYDFVIDDIVQWLPKVKKGGLIAGHDYMEKPGCGVIQAVTEIFPDHNANLRTKIWWVEKGEEIAERPVEPEEETEPEEVETTEPEEEVTEDGMDDGQVEEAEEEVETEEEEKKE